MSELFGTDYEGRKAIPIFEGVLMYFPKAIAAVAEVSAAGNKQHNPGQKLHWARGKSMDQYNTALRHMMDHRMGGGRVDPKSEDQEINNGWIPERLDTDGVRHLAKAAWRILAALELAIEEDEKHRDTVTVGGTGGYTAVSNCPSDIALRNCNCKKWNTAIDNHRWSDGIVIHSVDSCDVKTSLPMGWVSRV